jgi:hypothetical protein
MKVKLALLIVMIVILVSVAFMWRAARNEVFYLCGNFSPEVTQKSVLRQLDTATLSDYTIIQDEVVFSSQVNLRMLRCVIKFDENGHVISAKYR